LKHQFAEAKAIFDMKQKDKDYALSQKLTQRFNYPTLKEEWDDRYSYKKYIKYWQRRKREEENEKALGISKKARNNVNAALSQNTKGDDSGSDDANTTTNVMLSNKSKRSTVVSPKLLSEEEFKKLEKHEKAA